MGLYRVDFEPVGRRGQIRADETLSECARRYGIDLVSLCGGRGTCGRCKVQILEGLVTEATSNEINILSPQNLREGYRLACQTHCSSDIKVRLLPESLSSQQRTQVEGIEGLVSPLPPVLFYDIDLQAPTLSDFMADAERMFKALRKKQPVSCDSVDIEVLRNLPSLLRTSNWEATVGIRGSEVVALETAGSKRLGLAIDLGTTKVAGYLVNLDDGRTLAAKGAMNPQISLGEDIVTRITLAIESEDEASRLQEMAVDAINSLAVELCLEIGSDPRKIFEAVVVGNTAMHHLFIGLPVDGLVASPYVPAIKSALDIKARDLGIRIAPGAYVHMLPNVAGFVGADHVAMLLATGLLQSQGLGLALDIGTNTEVSLCEGGEITSVSCASGPAFEGAHIKHGMRASSGAIEHLRLTDGSVEYQTIGGRKPVGLCGSGILDALAQLHLSGVVNHSGRMEEHPRVRDKDGEREFVLISEGERDGLPAISISQKDIRQLQLAKGAIRTGIKLLVEYRGHSEQEISKVIVGGAFGSYIDLNSAVSIGLLPSLPFECFQQVGNAAGMGAKQCLVSIDKRLQAKDIAAHISYLELATIPHFSETFVREMCMGSN